MRILGRSLTSVSPQQTEGLTVLCSAVPAESINLLDQLSRWRHWGSGDVVVAGSPAHPDAAAWSTGSLIPFGVAPRASVGHVGASQSQLRDLARHARKRLAPRGSVFGGAADVEAIWRLMSGTVQSREERWDQPLLALPGEGELLARAMVARRPALRWVAEGVRQARHEEWGLVLPAAVDMFTHELGYDPTLAGGTYARSVEWLTTQGRTYVLFDDGAGRAPLLGGPRQVAFKADVGAMWRPDRGPGVAQVTGVWTRPDLRGQGIATVALAATVDAIRRTHVGPTGEVTLYVNNYNAPALGLYRALGARRIGAFATILL